MRTSTFGWPRCRNPLVFCDGLPRRSFPNCMPVSSRNGRMGLTTPRSPTFGKPWKTGCCRTSRTIFMGRRPLHLDGFARTPGSKVRWNDMFSTKPAFRSLWHKRTTCHGWSVSCAKKPSTKVMVFRMPMKTSGCICAHSTSVGDQNTQWFCLVLGKRRREGSIRNILNSSRTWRCP